MAKQTFTTGQVLTAAQMTSLQQTAMLGGAASAKTASYTLVAADAGTSISMSNASATTITVNTSLFAAGDTVQITNLGAGVCTITAGTATVNTSSSLALAQYESGTLDFTSTSAAIFIKGAGAVTTSGGMTLISTTTLTGASVTLSSIPQTYNYLYILIYGVTNATADGSLRIDANDASNTATIFGRQSTTSVGTQVDDRIYAGQGNNGDMLRTNANNCFLTRIYNYTSTTNFKTFDTIGIFNNLSTRTAGGGWGGLSTTSAITSLVLRQSGGNFSTGTVLLYGVK